MVGKTLSPHLMRLLRPLWVAVVLLPAVSAIAAPSVPTRSPFGQGHVQPVASPKAPVHTVAATKVRRAPFPTPVSRIDVFSAEDIARSGKGDLSSLFAGHFTGSR